MQSYKLMMLAFILVSSVLVAETFGVAASNMTQNVAARGVTTKVTYLNANSADEPRFQVVLDTHSVNLDAYDFKKAAVLRDDAGESYAPTIAENKGGGHHREVTLSFPKFTSGSKRVELVIKDIAGVKERTFVWNLE